MGNQKVLMLWIKSSIERQSSFVVIQLKWWEKMYDWVCFIDLGALGAFSSVLLWSMQMCKQTFLFLYVLWSSSVLELGGFNYLVLHKKEEILRLKICNG